MVSKQTIISINHFELTKMKNDTQTLYSFHALLVFFVHLFKVRRHAKRFNIWTQEIDSSNRDGYWLGYDNKIYFGHPMFIFFLSAQNKWWLDNTPKKPQIRP